MPPRMSVADILAAQQTQTPEAIAQRAQIEDNALKSQQLEGIRASILDAAKALILHLDGKTTKTEIVNQLQSLRLPDIALVVQAIQQLQGSTEGNKATISELTQAIKALLQKQEEKTPVNIHIAGLNHAGAYKPGITYGIGQGVNYQGSFYTPVRETSKAPSTADWQVISEKGAFGEKGDTGDAGVQGVPGLPGKNGKDGLDGLDGRDGIQGVKGDKGETGKKGSKGDKGDKGDDGRDGHGYRGVPGPGVAPGGTSGQVLAKSTADDFDTHWVDQTGGGGSALAVKDEGLSLDTAVTSVDFVGAGVTATNAGHAITVTVPDGGAGKVPTTTTVNGHALSSDVTVSATDVGLGNVDNTSNATERAAVATLTNKTLTSPTLVTPTLGVATATSVNKTAITAPATGSTLAVADGKTFTVSNTLTLAGGDGTTITFPSTTGTVATRNTGNTFTAGQAIQSSNAAALAVGPNGSTNPVLQVDDSTASAATGILLKGAAAAGGMALSTISSGSNESLKVDAKGTGTINLGSVSTGAVQVNSDTITTNTATQTLTNKRLTKRVLALSAGSATPAINTDSYDVVHITAQSAAITSFTSSLTGTPVDGDTLRISITDNGTARALTWGTSFEASTVALPTTTVINTRLDVGFLWNTETSKWRCTAVA